MNFLQPWMLFALPLMALPILIHLINQWRYQTKRWGAMMFLLAANRMNRGFARIRQWLILAMRTLAVAGLVFAVARPLASGLLGFSASGSTDTTIVIMDRSPSMQQLGRAGASKLQSGKRQLDDALRKLGSEHWVTINAAGPDAQAFETLDGLLQSSALDASSATSDLPSMLQTALEYLKNNHSGPSEVWICSDLRTADWNAESGTWDLIREGFDRLPQSVRFHLLAYPDPPLENVSVRVTEAQRVQATEANAGENSLQISLQFSRSHGDEPTTVPLQIEIDGTKTELPVELVGKQTELKNQRISLPRNQETGWGKVMLPADSNNSDNECYFVFAEDPVRRIVVVSEDREATRALEIAAGVSATGEDNSMVDVIPPEQLDSLVLDETALLIWQTALPKANTAPAVTNYVQAGGQVIFFPPSRLIRNSDLAQSEFLGVGWAGWRSERVRVENWRGDQDLLAATNSGMGLPVGQIELTGYATLRGEGSYSALATLTGGVPLLAKVPTDRGGVYFLTTVPDAGASSLAESGVALYVAIQRAIVQGQRALGNVTSRIAGTGRESTGQWRTVSGTKTGLSTELASHAGVYAIEDRMVAINRPAGEDRPDRLTDDQVESLFAGLPFAMVHDSAGNLAGIVREVWRLFLIGMLVAMLAEAALCLPRVSRRASANA